jgi:hypothetical protein
MKFEDIKEVSLREDGNVIVEAARVSLPGKIRVSLDGSPQRDKCPLEGSQGSGILGNSHS